MDNGLIRGRLAAVSERLAEELRRDAVERLGTTLSEKRPDEAVTADVEETESGVRITLHGNRSYFENLETKDGGERAVLAPTIEACMPSALRALGSLFD